MNLFTAEQARNLVESKYSQDLEDILSKIKKEAEKGNSVLHLYVPLKENTRKQLVQLGYQIPPASTIGIQKDGLYASIYWK